MTNQTSLNIEHLVSNSPDIGPDFPGHPVGQCHPGCPMWSAEAHPTDALRLVPVEPTEKMLAQGKHAYAMTHEDDALRGAWAVMLAAAPASPLPEGGGPTCQVCGSKIEAWTCQGCGAQFHENDAGSLVLGVPAAPTGDVK